MKRALSSLLTMALLFSLAACGSPSAPAASQTPAASQAPASEAVSDGSAPAGYPSQAVSLVVGFNPGGDSDLNNRLMAQYVEKRLGSSIAVQNMAGSNGAVAVTQYQSQPNDGYTIVGVNTSALLNNGITGNCQYTFRDMEVVGVFARGAGEMLFASKASGITSLEDLAAKTKENPGKLKLGMSSGGMTHVFALLLKNGGIDVNIVDGGDGANRIAQLVGGHVDACFIPYLTAKEYVEKGDVVPLGTIGARCSALPNTPALAETSYVENEVVGCYVWLAPKGTDPAVVNYLGSLMREVVEKDADYDKDQRAINFNDPVVYTGQEAIDWLTAAEQIAIDNMAVLNG